MTNALELRAGSAGAELPGALSEGPASAPSGRCLSRLATLGLCVILLAGGCSQGTEKPVAIEKPNTAEPLTNADPWFEEVAAAAGLTFQHTSGATGRFLFPEIMTGGVGLFDYDGDGWLDVYCLQGGSVDPASTNRPGNRLYRNRGDGTFEDVTAAAGVGDTGYGMGCACGDYDNDGDTDLYVTNVGRNVLYRNNGDGTFTDVTEQAGVGSADWGTSCAFVDYDSDGLLDLVVVNYIKWSVDQETDCYGRGGRRDYCSPMSYRAPAMDTLYHNRGDGTFEDVTRVAGLDQAYGNGLGVVCADFDQDGRVDIYVANDAMPNQLWMNQGGGRFKDEALIRGCAVSALGMSEAGMGVVAVDLQDDGWWDLFMTHLEGEPNRLYLNEGRYFTDTMLAQGPGAGSWPFTGFGVGFADFDHDGQLDLYVANGKVKFGQLEYDEKDPYAEPNHLLRGLGRGAFDPVPAGGLARDLVANSRGLALGDLDNDGDIDVVISNRDGPLHFLRNRVGNRGHWVLLRVLNRHGSDAIGAVVKVQAGQRTFWRMVQPGQGYCSSQDPRVHCGLGDLERIDLVTVRWPGGTEESFGPFPAGKIHVLRQGAGNPAETPAAPGQPGRPGAGESN